MPLEDLSPPPPNPVEAIEFATLPSRLLAGLIDYFFVTALYVLLSALVRDPDFAGLVTLLASMFYLSLGNSAVARGQSFGKRAFGLRVCAIEGGLLTMPKAVLRFFVWIGVIIICSELPALLFRHYAFRGEAVVLESPMLFVLSYFIGNLAMVTFDPLHRGLHDRAAGSIVLRTGTSHFERDSETAAKVRSLRGVGMMQSLGALAVGALIGALLWLLGVQNSPGVALVSRNRYLIEHELPVRISGLQEENGTTTVDLLIFDSTPGQGKMLAPRILELLSAEGPVPGSTLRLRFYADPAKLPPDAPPGPEEVSLPLVETDIPAK